MMTLTEGHKQEMEARMPIERKGSTFLSVKEFAEKLGVHPNTVLYWIKQDRIRAVRSGFAKQSPWIIPIEDANNLIEELASE
jgi:excisionase family DNA binding protein